MSGRQISETTISNICEARRRLATSPLAATSTLWPSFRKLISSNSQMERSSSTISKWAMPRLPLPCYVEQVRMGPKIRVLDRNGLLGARQLDDKFGTSALLPIDTDPAAMRLQNLVYDGETESRAAGESRLKRLENAGRLA